MLTLCVELRSVFVESFEEHLIPQQLQEGREGRRCLLIIVHLLLCALTRSAQKNTHFVLLTQLHTHTEQTVKTVQFKTSCFYTKLVSADEHLIQL